METDYYDEYYEEEKKRKTKTEQDYINHCIEEGKIKA